MIRAVFFDYGGVISDGGGRYDLPNRLAATLNISAKRAYELLAPIWGPYMHGRLAESEVWRNIETAYGSPITPDKRAIWNSWQQMRPRAEIVALINRLKKPELTLGLLSNTSHDIQSHGGYDMFDFIVLSHEVGFAKPEPAMYELAAKRLPALMPAEIVFIDDTATNLLPAEHLGWQTILASTGLQVVTDIMTLLKARGSTNAA
jgi:HAD superfamily hydrolase (TIGR01509 family)